MAKGRGGKQKGFESVGSSIFDALFAVRNSPKPKIKPTQPTGLSGTSAFADAALDVALAPIQNIGDDVLGEITGTLGGGKLVEFQLTKGMGPNASKVSVKGSSLAGFIKDPGALIDKAYDDLKARKKASTVLGIPGTNQDAFIGAAAGFIAGAAVARHLGSSPKEAEKIGLGASSGRSNDRQYDKFLNDQRIDNSAEMLAATAVKRMYDKGDPGNGRKTLEAIIKKEFTTYSDPKDASKGRASLDIGKFDAKKGEIVKELQSRGYSQQTIDKLMTGMEGTIRDVLSVGHASNTDVLTPNLYREIMRKDLEEDRRLSANQKELDATIKKLEFINVHDDLYRSGAMDFARINERIDRTLQTLDRNTEQGKRAARQLEKSRQDINKYNAYQSRPWNDGKDTKSADVLRGAENGAMQARLVELQNSPEFRNGDPATLSEYERLSKSIKFSKYSQSARWKSQALFANLTAFKTINSMGWNQVGRYMFMPGKHDDLGIIRPSDGFSDDRHYSLAVGGKYVTDSKGNKVWKAETMQSGGVRIERDVSYWMRPVTRMQYFMPGNLIGGVLTGNTFKAMATWQTQDFMKQALRDKELMGLIQNNKNLFDGLDIFRKTGEIDHLELAKNMDQVLMKLGGSVHGNARIKGYLSKFKGIQRLGQFYNNTYFKVLGTFTGGFGLLSERLSNMGGPFGTLGKFMKGKIGIYDVLQDRAAGWVEGMFKGMGRGLAKLGFKGFATSVAGLFATPIGGILVSFLTDAFLQISKPFLKFFMWMLASLFILPCIFFFFCSDILQQGNSQASFIPVESPFSVYRSFYGGGGTSQPTTPYNDTDGSYDPGTVIPVGSGYLRGIIDADLIPEVNESFDVMCPFTGDPVCTQGPSGPWSHNGYETDLGGNPGEFVAPTDGWIENYIPNVVCEWDGFSNRGGELQFVGCDGTVYQLLHVESSLPRATREQKNCANPQLKRGDLVANEQNVGASGACWSGMHYHVEIFRGTTVNSLRYLNSTGEHSNSGLNCGISGAAADGCL